MYTQAPITRRYYFLAALVIYCLWSIGAAEAEPKAPENTLQYLPKSVAASLEKNQIPKDAISISVTEIQGGRPSKAISKTELDWRAKEPMNPASTMKLLTTLTGLDVLGPEYRWRTKLFTDGAIKQGTLKGNIYLQGSAYAPSVMEHNTIDGESLRAYNVPPDPLLYAFRTLSFQLGKSRTADFIDIDYTPKLSLLKVSNQMQLIDRACDNWKSNLRFNLDSDGGTDSTNQTLTAVFSGGFPNTCKGVNYNVVAMDANTFLTQGFAAAWELAGGSWAQAPIGRSGNVPLAARLLLQFEGIKLADDVLDINKYSNNVMARQLLLTLALEKMGKPATTENGNVVIQSWLKEQGLEFPELVIENGSGLSRTESISAENLNQVLVTARNLSVGDIFYNSLPIAGTDGTMRNRLMSHLRKFLHLKKKPEARIKTGSLADVRAISGYVMSKSGKMYAVTSFINHPNARKGLEAHDQLLAWLLEDGPDPKQAR
ncbi:MAG: D-alanyl-D-alanine carboxypeptidase [Polynucleobacter sp. 39-45-136]|nr:MAG: D-alanyl-D-alanine carboxypeptidase [Polynucleobacter sp. 39-45-136]